MDFQKIGAAFVKQYYDLFDQKDTRSQTSNMYHPTESCLTFEGQQFQGSGAIVEKHANMPFANLYRVITTSDFQPIPGGVLIQVLGQLRTDSENDKIMGFSQTFLVRDVDNNFFILNDIFRLLIHNV